MALSEKQNIGLKYSHTTLLNELNNIYDNKIQLHTDQINNLQQEKNFYKKLLYVSLCKELDSNKELSDTQEDNLFALLSETQKVIEDQDDKMPDEIINDVAYDNNLKYQNIFL